MRCVGPAGFPKKAHGWLIVAICLLILQSSEACTTFCVVDGGRVVFGRNYDYGTGVGRLTVNRRGYAKSAFDTGSGFRWVSRFGSVTFDQFGCEFPTGGMNEAGLVVELMLLEGTQYPEGSTPTLSDLQWIQYQLDTSATVADVLASDREVRIHPGSSPLHFLVADRAGHRATIEFIAGRRVVHVDESLPVAALTNSPYDDAIAFAAQTTPGNIDAVSSLGRFVHAADAVWRVEAHPVADLVGYAFDTLESVQQPGWTRWNVVYDVTNLTLHFRSDSARRMKQVRLRALDFAPSAPFRVADINDTVAGDENVSWGLYSPSDNLTLLNEVYRATGIPATPGYIQLRAAYPDSVQPASPLRLAAHPSSATAPAGSIVSLTAQAESAGAVVHYQWTKDDAPLVGATAATLELRGLNASDAGDYRVIVTDQTRFTVSRVAALIVAPPEPGRLVNVSVRGRTGRNGQPLIVGFVTSGGVKHMLVRAIGPTLAQLNVRDALPDPSLEIHSGTDGSDRIVCANNDWGEPAEQVEALASICRDLGAFAVPAGSRDAMQMLWAEGPRTVHVASAIGRDSGVVLVEAYDAAITATPRLVNVSARNYVGTDADVLIAGFVINGNTPKKLLIRGVGPEIANFNVAQPLQNPQLELHRLHRGADEIFAVNDNWGTEPGASVAAADSGAFPLSTGSLDAALVVVVPAGIYTAIVSGVHGLTGEGLVEIYELP